MQVYNYKVVIEECEEGGFYAECPAFPGCHVEGETYEETIKEMKEEELPSDNFLVTSIQVAI